MSRPRASAIVTPSPRTRKEGRGEGHQPDLKPLVKIAHRQLRLSNLNKVLYPDSGFTKGDAIAYYRAIASVMLKHLRGRPVTLKRYPNGVAEGFFYEKNCPAHKPTWVPTTSVRGRDGTTHYCLIEDPATLVWVANLAALELHTLLSRTEDLDRPTMMVFDLDPGPPATLLDCLRLGLKLRDLFANLGRECFPKTSGGKGLHVCVPLNTPVTFDQTKHFAHAVAMVLERSDPQQVTSTMRKDLRPGKVFVDWSQNDQHKTTVCAYSLRARREPTVSTPVTWPEIESALRRRRPESLAFRTDQVLARIERFGDLFAPVLKLRQKLPRL